MPDAPLVSREAIDRFIAERGVKRGRDAEWRAPPTVAETEAMRRELAALEEAGRLLSGGVSTGRHWRDERAASYRAYRAKQRHNERKRSNTFERYKALVNRGLTPAEIGHELGIHPKSVLSYCRRVGLIVRKPATVQTLTEDETAIVRRMVAQDATIAEMGEALGLTKHQMRRRLERLGVKGQPGTRSKLDYGRIRALFRAGHSYAEIGRRMGCHGSTVAKALYRMGLCRRGASESIRQGDGRQA